MKYNLILNILKPNTFYILKLPIELSIFIKNNEISNFVQVDHRSDLLSFISQYQNFSIGEFLKTFGNDVLFNNTELDFINSSFYIKNLSKIGQYCFYSIEAIKRGDIIAVDLDGFSHDSQYLCFEFLKKMSEIFINKVFIAIVQNVKFEISAVNRKDTLFDFKDELYIQNKEDIMQGLYNRFND